MMGEFADVAVVQSILDVAEKTTKTHSRWLPYMASPAFLCCLGAGPWKYGRRRKIQHEALLQLGGRDIGQLPTDARFFPLDWQNRMLNAMTATLQRERGGIQADGAMVSFVSVLRDIEPAAARERFYRACGRPGGTKVLSLYLRDYVNIPCFPVDRHVRRSLEKLGLPIKEQPLLDLFARAKVDPVPVARFLGTKDLDGNNPDWSGWPNRVALETVKHAD
jgi:hypothetical protein